MSEYKFKEVMSKPERLAPGHQNVCRMWRNHRSSCRTACIA